jgi:hypothetical protein
MTIRYQLIVAILACVLVDITGAAAQQTAAPSPSPPAAPDRPTPIPSTAKPDVNIQIDATIQSQGSNTPLLSKSITTIVTNGGTSVFRLQPGDQAGPHVNGDFRAAIRDGRIEVTFSLDVYITEANSPEVRYRGSNRLIVENSKAMIVSKVPDPLTNRTVTVAITARILK